MSYKNQLKKDFILKKKKEALALKIKLRDQHRLSVLKKAYENAFMRYEERPPHAEDTPRFLWEQIVRKANERVLADMRTAKNVKRVVAQMPEQEVTIPLKNRYEVLSIEGTKEEVFVEEAEEAEEASFVRTQRRWYEPIFYGPYHMPKPVVEFTTYLQSLMAALRDRIAMLAELRKKKSYRDMTDFEKLAGPSREVYKPCEMAQSIELDELGTVPYIKPVKRLEKLVINQMDDKPHGSCDVLKVEQKSNVILTTHTTEESKADPITIPSDNWQRMCTSEPSHAYNDLMGRWLKFKTIKWSRDFNSGYMISDASAKLPIDFVKANWESPNCILFKSYAYFRSDLEIKIVLNSNKFHCGALQASFYYGASSDMYYKDRQNIASASQMTHCIIDAASATDGILTIPYRHYKPLMGTTNRNDDMTTLDMGHFRLFVLNQLKTPTDDNNVIDVTIFIRFVNPMFHGMKPRDIGAVNQMFGTSGIVGIAKDAAKLVNQIFPDDQRDNPSDVLPPKPMVPWSAHSWCLGDSTPEPINPLRLQASGNTPHPPGTLPVEKEMQIDYVARIFGLIRQVKWTTSHSQGTILSKLPFSPMLEWDDYMQYTVKNTEERICSALPPVSVISQLFAYWRGSMEYRLDFVATQFHTGRLMIAYLPRVIAKTDPTLEQLTHCDHIVIDLREERQVNYVCNYLSDKPWWPRRGDNDKSTEIYPPGYIYIMVMNQLTATSAVTKEIEFNIYMRGGKDFEFHVPVSPMIGLSYNTNVLGHGKWAISYKDDYGPNKADMYVGGWHAVKPNAALLRYGPGSDHMTQFDLKNVGKIFELQTGIPIVGANNIKYPYLAIFSLKSDNYAYAYGAVFSTLTNLKRMNLLFNSTQGKLDTSIPSVLTCFESIGTDGDYVDKSSRYWWKPVKFSDLEWEILVENAGGEERSKVCGDQVEINRSLSSTWNGLLTFGEQITNFKQLLRRYQPYGQFISNTSGQSDPSMADFAIPIIPQGLDLVVKDSANKEFRYGNQLRDGPIPIIASGYRFFRGGVRLRLAVMGKEEAAIWIQHRPEYNISQASIYKPEEGNMDKLYQPGYASLVQFTSMNNVVEFEVPFYLPGQFGILQRPRIDNGADAVHYSLGTLYCGVDTMKGVPKEIPYFVQCYYSMADDMSFSVFQGFPLMIDLSVFKAPMAQADDEKGGWFSGIMSFGASKATDVVAEKVTQKVAGAVDEILEEKRKEKEKTDKEANLYGAIMKMVNEFYEDATDAKKYMLISVVSNLVHCIINPDIKTVAWAIVSLLAQLGLICADYVSALASSLSAILRKLSGAKMGSKKCDKDPKAVVANDAHESVNVDAAFVSTIVTSMLALAGHSDKPIPKNIPNFAAYLYHGLPKFTLTATSLYKFLCNNLEVFKRIWYWLVAKFQPDHVLYAELTNAPIILKEFVAKAMWSLDPLNERAVRTDIRATTQVYELANHAQAYMAKKALSVSENKSPYFDYYCRKIISLKEDLTREMLSPAVRFEPFVISFNGPSNCGKSHMAQYIAKELLKFIDYRTYDELVYVRTPANPYWNGLRNQPICLFDDFLQIEASEQAHIQLGELFCLKSKAVFNPPMAAIEEKKIRYNPLIVILLNNKAFPKIDGMACEEAWRRRRDILIEVNKKDEYKGIHPRALPSNIKTTYGHLEFGIYEDPSGVTSTRTPDCTMNFESIMAKLAREFTEYFQEECIQYDISLQQMSQFYPEVDESNEDYIVRYEKEMEKLGINKSKDPSLIEHFKRTVFQKRYAADLTKYVNFVNEKQKLNDLAKEKVKPINNAGVEEPPKQVLLQKKNNKPVPKLKKEVDLGEPPQPVKKKKKGKVIRFESNEDAISIWTSYEDRCAHYYSNVPYNGNFGKVVRGKTVEEVLSTIKKCEPGVFVSLVTMESGFALPYVVLWNGQDYLKMVRRRYFKLPFKFDLSKFFAKDKAVFRQILAYLLDLKEKSTIKQGSSAKVSEIVPLKEVNKRIKGIKKSEVEIKPLVTSLEPEVVITSKPIPLEPEVIVKEFFKKDASTTMREEMTDRIMHLETDKPEITKLVNEANSLKGVLEVIDAREGQKRISTVARQTCMEAIHHREKVIEAVDDGIISYEAFKKKSEKVWRDQSNRIVLDSKLANPCECVKFFSDLEYWQSTYIMPNDNIDNSGLLYVRKATSRAGKAEEHCYCFGKCIKDETKYCLFTNIGDLSLNCPVLYDALKQIPPRHWPVAMYDRYLQSKEDSGGNIVYSPPAVSVDVVCDQVASPTFLNKVWEKLKSFGKVLSVILKAAAVITAISSIIHIFSCAIDWAFGTNIKNHSSKIEYNITKLVEPTENAGYSSGTVAAKSHGVVLTPKAWAQASEEQNTVVQRIIMRNTFFLYANYTRDGQTFNKAFRCLGLLGRSYLLLDHYVYFLRSVENLKLYYVQGSCRNILPNSILDNLRCIVDSTFVVGELPVCFPSFKDLLKFFAKGRDHANMSTDATLYENKYREESDDFLLIAHPFERIKFEKNVGVQNDIGPNSQVDALYSYPKGGRGMCGSVLMTDMNTPRPIIGIHVAGFEDGSRGFAEAVVFETFEILKKNSVNVEENSGIIMDLNKKAIMELNTNVIREGVVNKAIYPPTKSRLIHTECAGQFGEITYETPILHSSDERIREAPFSPLLMGCMHHGNPCYEMEDEFVEAAIEDYRDTILSSVFPRRRVAKLSVAESVCGLYNNPEYEAMVMDTSEGYPWVLNRPVGASNKSWMFKIEETQEGPKLHKLDPSLSEKMKQKQEMRNMGIIPETIFTDCLKDAKLPKEKVCQPGKTRIFSISPVDFTIQQRQYTLDFVVAFEKARLNAEHAIGIDIYGIETDTLVRHMQGFSPYFITGDYSKFGDQLYAKLILAAYSIIADWYELNGIKDPLFRRNLEVMAREIANAKHLMLNLVYSCIGGMPSGNPLTVIINSMVNSMYIRIMWQKIMKLNNRFDYYSLASFHKNVRIVTFGDDIWMSVMADVLPYFNGVALSEAFASYNIKFTNSCKSGEMLPFSRIEDPETTFLKCTFHRHEFRNLWIARLEKRVVEEVSNWTWSTQRNIRESSLEACVQMLELSYGHGKEYHDARRRLVTDFWIQKGVKFVAPSWNDLDLRIYSCLT